MAESGNHIAINNIGSWHWASGLDELDYRLVLELKKNPRVSNTKLASLTGISETAVRRRIDRLVNSGRVILTAIPNLGVFGYPLMAMLELKVEIARVYEVAECLCAYPNITWVTICTGNSDIFARGFFRSNEDLSKFVAMELGKIAGIIQTETMIQLQQLKGVATKSEDDPLRGKHQSTKIPQPVFDKIDYSLILELQNNARVSSRRLAKVIGTSSCTIGRRIKRLVDSGGIVLTSIPISGRLDLPARCVIGLETDLAHLDAIASKLTSYPQVHAVFLVSGTIQILFTVYDSSIERLATFFRYELSQINGVTRVTTWMQLDILKSSHSWLQPELLPM
ncbi:Lrp/AsnC family transcriptional regulator [Chloroflexota bacterium]